MLLSDSHYDERTVALDLFREEELTAPEKIRRLRDRISRGTDHPPCIKINRAFWFPKEAYRDWVGKKHIIEEVKSNRAS